MPVRKPDKATLHWGARTAREPHPPVRFNGWVRRLWSVVACFSPWHRSLARKSAYSSRSSPETHLRGRLGEDAARKYLRRAGLKILTANFRSAAGEIDLIAR